MCFCNWDYSGPHTLTKISKNAFAFIILKAKSISVQNALRLDVSKDVFFIYNEDLMIAFVLFCTSEKCTSTSFVFFLRIDEHF